MAPSGAPALPRRGRQELGGAGDAALGGRMRAQHDGATSLEGESAACRWPSTSDWSTARWPRRGRTARRSRRRGGPHGGRSLRTVVIGRMKAWTLRAAKRFFWTLSAATPKPVSSTAARRALPRAVRPPGPSLRRCRPSGPGRAPRGGAARRRRAPPVGPHPLRNGRRGPRSPLRRPWTGGNARSCAGLAGPPCVASRLRPAPNQACGSPRRSTRRRLLARRRLSTGQHDSTSSCGRGMTCTDTSSPTRRAAGGPGVGRRLDRSDVAAHEHRDEARADVLLADEHDVGRLHHCVGGFDGADQTLGLDEAERFTGHGLCASCVVVRRRSMQLQSVRAQRAKHGTITT